MEKRYELPPIVWLKVTGYMHYWLQHELGGGARIGNQLVICTQHLPGARDVLKMETVEDLLEKKKVNNAMSGVRKLVVCAGLDLDADVMEREYGVTKKLMKMFVPIECPRMCLTKYGVLRPWTLNVCFGKEQASAMQRLLRDEFWKAVWRFNDEYAKRMNGKKYPAVDMIEDFCTETGTPDLYVEEMRREWQRRVKRAKSEE